MNEICVMLIIIYDNRHKFLSLTFLHLIKYRRKVYKESRIKG